MQAFHITWVTHNSRESERMKMYNVRKGKAVILSAGDEIEITRYILNVVREDKIKIIAYNICRDHVHLILVCMAEERDKVVKKLKSVSAMKYNFAHGKSISLSQNLINQDNVNKKRGKTQSHLWAQKYNWSCILNETQLAQVWGYVTYNRIKHNLPDNEELNRLIDDMLTPYDKIFDQEIQGGKPPCSNSVPGSRPPCSK